MSRLVVIPRETLVDLCNMAELASNKRAEEIGFADSLVHNLRGAVRESRHRARLEQPELVG